MCMPPQKHKVHLRSWEPGVHPIVFATEGPSKRVSAFVGARKCSGMRAL
jgi:hypothetical protein